MLVGIGLWVERFVFELCLNVSTRLSRRSFVMAKGVFFLCD